MWYACTKSVQKSVCACIHFCVYWVYARARVYQGQVQIPELAAFKTSVWASEAMSQSYEPHVNQLARFIGDGFKLNYIREYEAMQTTHTIAYTHARKKGCSPTWEINDVCDNILKHWFFFFSLVIVYKSPWTKTSSIILLELFQKKKKKEKEKTISWNDNAITEIKQAVI